MKILVNGETMEVPAGTTVETLLMQLGLAGRRVAVAVNGEVIPSGSFQEQELREGDEVEIVHAVGGG